MSAHQKAHKRRRDAATVKVLVLTINEQRHVFAAPIPNGKDPMEMTLGEWEAAPVLSANAIMNDFLARRSAG